MNLVCFAFTGAAIVAAAPSNVLSQEPAALQDRPGADQIVQMARRSLTPADIAGQPMTFTGKHSCGETSEPFRLERCGNRVRFDFFSREHSIGLQLGEKGHRLTEFTGGVERDVPLSMLVASIHLTGLTFEDLSMRWLHWPKKVLMGEETIKTRKCHVVDLYNPQREGEYYLVRIFVDREKGWLMRMQAYDWNGKLVKSCAVTAGMKVNGFTFLKNMEVIRYVPGSKKISSKTTIELEKPALGGVSANDPTPITLKFWRQLHFGTSANAGDGADTADFDNDGLTNLTEFAFGLDPTHAASAQLPRPEVQGDNLHYRFDTPHGVSGITYSAEWSTTLQPHDWRPIPDTGTGSQHLFSFPVVNETRWFTRLVVTAPPP